MTNARRRRQKYSTPISFPHVLKAFVHRITGLFFCALLAAPLGCTRHVRRFSPHEAVSALNKKSAAIQTVRGRAWIKAYGPQQKISFPAVIVVDRTIPQKPMMRIEASDPFGTVHGLMILDSDQRFTWIDFDQGRYYEMHSTWNGLPLAKLPELLLGVSSFSEVEHRFEGSSGDSILFRSPESTVSFLMSWIDPGPMLALSGLSGEFKSQRYRVEYSHFLDKEDFYLPSNVVVKGYGATQHVGKPSDQSKLGLEPDVEFDIRWREREWNAKIAPELFILPRLDSFQKN